MNDRELLEYIAAQVGGLTMSVDGLTKDVSELKKGQKKMEYEVAGVKDEVASVKAEVAGVKDEVASVKVEVAGVKAEVASVKKITLNMEENHGKQLTALFDGYKQNSEKLDRIEKEVSKHEEIILRRIK